MTIPSRTEHTRPAGNRLTRHDLEPSIRRIRLTHRPQMRRFGDDDVRERVEILAELVLKRS
jgi:hypothetical protein